VITKRGGAHRRPAETALCDDGNVFALGPLARDDGNVFALGPSARDDANVFALGPSAKCPSGAYDSQAVLRRAAAGGRSGRGRTTLRARTRLVRAVFGLLLLLATTALVARGQARNADSARPLTPDSRGTGPRKVLLLPHDYGLGGAFRTNSTLSKRPDGSRMTDPPMRIESDTAGGWRKYPGNPVLGGRLGTCFDAVVLKERGRFRMWFSWRPRKSIAYTESADGIHWQEPVIALAPQAGSGWEEDVNRPSVVHRGKWYEMWYTGQAHGRSAIGYADSSDGVKFERKADQPVLRSDVAWEKGAAMCPHVLWDGMSGSYRMWYSAGDQYEPDSIGYAESTDGRQWTKSAANPIFTPDRSRLWESHKVTACHVMREGAGYLMFYIGFQDENRAQIGMARSKDGLHWERFDANPIVRPGADAWDADAVYKPTVVRDGGRWLLWYNGRRGGTEQIGLAVHDGADLWK